MTSCSQCLLKYKKKNACNNDSNNISYDDKNYHFVGIIWGDMIYLYT